MSICSICDLAVEGPRLTDPETGDQCHGACFADRVPKDAVGALVAASLLVLAPLIIVWAA